MAYSKIPASYLKCPYSGSCGARTESGECSALEDVEFSDGRCHFQKPSGFDESARVLTKDEIIEMYNDRVPMAEICAQADAGIDAVTRLINKAKKEGLIKTERYHRVTDDDREKAVKLFKGGMSKRRISKEIGVYYEQILKILKGVEV